MIINVIKATCLNESINILSTVPRVNYFQDLLFNELKGLNWDFIKTALQRIDNHQHDHNRRYQEYNNFFFFKEGLKLCKR